MLLGSFLNRLLSLLPFPVVIALPDGLLAFLRGDAKDDDTIEQPACINRIDDEFSDLDIHVTVTAGSIDEHDQVRGEEHDTLIHDVEVVVKFEIVGHDPADVAH